MSMITTRVILFYVAAMGFALGIFVRSFVEIGLPEISFFILISFGLAALHHKNGGRTSTFVVSAPFLASVFLLVFALGALRFEWASWSEINPQLENQVGTEVTLKGVVVREPDERESTTHLYTKVDLPASSDTSRQVSEIILMLADRFQDYSYGDVISVTGQLSKPESFETDLGRTFNYPGYLQARNVSYTVRFADVVVIGSGEGNPVLATLLNFKHRFMYSVELLLPEPQVGLGEGLLLGVKRALGEDLEQVFRETGIIHIVVLSGYNVMLVVIFVTYLLAVVIPTRFQLPFGLAAIAAFALMVGLSATVVRASVMAAIYMLARSLNRTYLVLRALLLAGVVMLLLNPYLLVYDTGFQLSFVATLGLILAAPWIEAKLSAVPNTIVKTREFLTATLATQIFVLPILLYQIGEFSVVSVMVNVLVLPMVPVAMLLTFITGLIGFVAPTVAGFFALLTYWSLSYIVVVAKWFAALPFASFIVPAFPFWLVLVTYAVLGYMLWKLYQPKKVETKVEKGAEEFAEYADWVIEEEEVVRERLKQEAKAAAPSLPAAPSEAQAGRGAAADTPVFFRKTND